VLPDDIAAQFGAARTIDAAWPHDPFDLTNLYWHLIASNIPQEELQALCERLMFAQTTAESMKAARQLVEQMDYFASPALKPSTITGRLKSMPELALFTAWLRTTNDQIREVIQRYWMDWQHVQPITNGHTLREMSLSPGPCYSVILKRLRDAWLDGDIQNDEGEKRLIQKLIDEGVCDDSP
jgi:tRNA nucleotidyltransferase (CCA-adding enzyme)